MERTEEIVKDILVKMFCDDVEKQQIIYNCDNPDLIKDLKFDSILVLEFIVELEERFGVSLESEEEMLDVVWNYKELIEWLKTHGRKN